MTVWKNIKRLPPGHFICFDLQSGELEISRYIKPINNRFLGNMDDAIDNYHNMLLSAIKRQLISDVPIGLLLSGGIDSALVAALAKEMDVELPCFTVGFGSKHNECEIDNAADTANFLGLPFNKIQVNSEDLKNSLSEIAKTIEEPLGTTSVMPMWHLVQRARENVTVVLTGQGSDEPWGGYFRYQVELLRNRIPWTFLWRISKNLSSAWPWKSDAFIRGLGTLSKQDPINQIMEACSLFSSDDRSLLLGDTDDGGASLQIRNWIEWLSCISDLSSVERMMRLDTRMNLGDDLLLYGDKISMAVSLETRVPMLDIELVNFIESLPINYKIGWGSGKLVHKMMAEKYLPHEIVHRPKKGFQVPFSEWSRGIWRSWIEELLFDGLNGILKKEGIEYLWKQHLEKRPDRSRQIFALIMLSLWHREHICNK